MKLEQQVCSLELSKKLKELGVKQESLFYWKHHIKMTGFTVDFIDMDTWSIENDNKIDNFYTDEWVSAFTVAELGEMLRPHLNKNIWLSEIDEVMNCAVRMEDEANNRAKMLVYLLENNLTPLH